MSDEKILELIEGDLKPWVHPIEVKPVATDVLAGLRGAGYELYRPDDCEQGEITGATFNIDIAPGAIGLIVEVPSRPVYGGPAQRVALVPIEKETDDES